MTARYIVIVSPSYGGAEKRFFDIYTGLRRRAGDIHYVAPSTLLDRLKKDHPERSDVFAGLVPVHLPRWSARGFLRAYRRVLRSLPRESVFHYPMQCLWPLHFGRGDSLSLSFVDCTMVPRLLTGHRNALLAYVASFFAQKIDILSPMVFDALEGTAARRKAALTPGGTFLIPPATIEAGKPPVVAFFGRLIREKGIEDLLDIVPTVWQALQARAPNGFKFVLAGYGPLERFTAAGAKALRARGVPIEYVGYQTAEAIVRTSSIVLSLQRSTNYPSRVVAEALTAGCGVIVRRSGDSTEFGELPGLIYCADPLDAADLADGIDALLERMESPSFCREIHVGAVQRFCNAQYLEYFDSMMSGRASKK